MKRKLHPHDLLANLILNVSLPVTTAENPVGINGILKSEFGYVFDLKTYKENYEKIFQEDNLKPSDGFLSNPSKKNCSTIECKSFVDEDDEKFREQIEFYSENSDFKSIFVPEDFNHEILVVIFNEEELVRNTIKNIEQLQNEKNLATNTVVWAVEHQEDETYVVKKLWGDHIHDDDLEKRMSNEGLLSTTLHSVLLITPETPTNYRVAEVAKRLLIFRASEIKLEITIAEFIARQQGDSTLPDKMLNKLVRTALRLVPSLGEAKNGTIQFKKNPRLSSVQEQIQELLNDNAETYNARLLKLTKKDKQEEKKSKKRDPNQTSLDGFA